ncbi:MAG: hypothetical protein AB7P69_19205 [Candidatus Binatia bacterium]
MAVHVLVVPNVHSGGEQPSLDYKTRCGQLFLRWIFLLLFLLGRCPPAHAACDDNVSALTQEIVLEEHALRMTEQAVRSSKTKLQMFDADLQALLANPPPTYDRTLARQLATLRRTEVESKRRTLENLRAQHEESRRQWERGHQRLGPQLAEARTAYRAQTITSDEFCRIQETYAHALRLYIEGMKDYRRGMELYTRALDECVDRFLSPSIKGFTDPRYWEELIVQLERGDFLHDILVPMTVNAIRSVPPDAPPE